MGLTRARLCAFLLAATAVLSVGLLTAPHDISQLSFPGMTLGRSRRHASCPSLHATKPSPIAHDAQTCSAVPSTDPAFALTLCHDPRTCNAFTLRVARTNLALCSELEDARRRLSDDDELERWIRAELGPDAFDLRTDGAERYASATPIYEGACRWRFDVQLRNAGPVLLSAWHTHEVRRVLHGPSLLPA